MPILLPWGSCGQHQVMPCEAKEVKRLLSFEFAPFLLSFILDTVCKTMRAGGWRVGEEAAALCSSLLCLHQLCDWDWVTQFVCTWVFSTCKVLVSFSQWCCGIRWSTGCLGRAGLNGCFPPHPIPCTLFCKVQKACLRANHLMCLDSSLLPWKMELLTSNPNFQNWSWKILGVGSNVSIWLTLFIPAVFWAWRSTWWLSFCTVLWDISVLISHVGCVQQALAGLALGATQKGLSKLFWGNQTSEWQCGFGLTGAMGIIISTWQGQKKSMCSS